MTTEVHIFLAKATASGVERFPIGQRHAMHIYVRQPLGSAHDWESAEFVALNCGWSQVEILKAGTLSANSAESKGEPERSCYHSALESGDAILVYSTPEPRHDHT
jgi:hypothetical protein